MKKLILVIALGAIGFGASAQVIVGSNGRVGIGMNPSSGILAINGWIYYFPVAGSKAGVTQIWATGIPGAGKTYIDLVDNYVTIGQSSNRLDQLYAYYINCQTLYTSSDMRQKDNIRPLGFMLSKLKNVQSYNYNFTDEYFKNFTSEEKQKAQKTEYGFLAQELETIFPELVHADDSTGLLSINYIGMIPVLTSAINELQQEISTLRGALNICCSKSNQKSMGEEENNSIQQLNLNTEDMKLYQNIPNPFNVTTTIQCLIPETIQKVELCVYNMQGIQLKCLPVSGRGMTMVQIEAGQLAAGVYTYLLIGDGKTSDAKQMILTK